jgi:hypothetical protein
MSGPGRLNILRGNYPDQSGRRPRVAPNDWAASSGIFKVHTLLSRRKG